MKAAQLRSTECFRQIRKAPFTLSGSAANLRVNSGNVNMIRRTLRIKVSNFGIKHVSVILFALKELSNEFKMCKK